ncbi:MAG: glycosyltransferase family 39 protein [Rhodobiaceae bacterium]|nr:glycosyltransferase family 39 protein [Rhodobiaceae bacterium]
MSIIIINSYYKCIRSSIIQAAIYYNIGVYFTSEFLSYLEILNIYGIFSTWAIFNAILYYKITIINSKNIDEHSIQLNIDEEFIYILCILVIITVLIIGSISPPNNWDSMTYHLPRVLHWAQNESLDYYQTTITRQLISGTFAEVIIFHTYILSGGDYYFNAVQGIALAGSAVASSLLAKRLGASSLGQAAAAAFVIMLPMGVLQASSTQNDIVVSFFLISAVERLFAWSESTSPEGALAVGGGFGLAILTKGTAYFFAAPFLIFALLFNLAKREFFKVTELIAIGAVILVCNLGQYVRNFVNFGMPLGDQGIVANATPNFETFVVNLIRNVAINFNMPWQEANGRIMNALIMVFNQLQLDMNPPEATFKNTSFALNGNNIFHEDIAPNTIHIIIIISIILIVLWKNIIITFYKIKNNLFNKKIITNTLIKKMGYEQKQIYYITSTLSGACLFVLLLRWQPWITRLETPIFVLMAPAVPVLLPSIFDRKWITPFVCGGLFVFVTPWLLLNESRPILGEPSIFSSSGFETMFRNKPGLRQPYSETMAYVRSSGAAEVGLIMGRDTWEYPAWVLLNSDRRLTPIRIEQICIPPKSGPKEDPSFKPQIAVLLGRNATETINCESGTFKREVSFGSGRDQLVVYHRVGDN